MAVMVTFVGMLIFVFSVGYMREDRNFARFFCFLSLFAAAMLGLLVANSLLLLFICWEGVGLASYLLIGFWFEKPEAAAAAKKAFITTRIGDLGFLLGMVWLYNSTGTLLFYDGGHGLFDGGQLGLLNAHLIPATFLGLALPPFGRDQPAAVLRRSRQIGPVPAACVAPGCHGGAHAGERPDPRGHDGCRRRVSCGPHLSR